ncbi:tetratricopeptide repeat protein [Sodalinema gerasimenkoae]|uniref:tetratricopeptide repeat protein n=1 Tax=Sodalinema gerasimenkoae TaxID=2862348 RepID=UPI00135CB7BC|nr:tetratricopeptide repeat protein [Sodalinema gerasimenkoae]
MANSGKLVGMLAATALWLSAVEGVMAAGRRQIAAPTQGTPGELWLFSDLTTIPAATPLQVIGLETKSLQSKAGLPLPTAPQGPEKVASLSPYAGSKQAETAAVLEVEGQLEDGDEVLQDGSLYDLYTFEVEAGQFVEIRLNSDDFDAYLILVGPDGERVAEDDDGGEGLNALILIQLPQTGRYSVIANAYDAAGRGRYRLTVAAYQWGQERAGASASLGADQISEQGIQQFNRSQFREALCQEVGDRGCEGSVSVSLGNVYFDAGQFEEAIYLYEQSLTIARGIGDRAGEIQALRALANAYSGSQNSQQAAYLYYQFMGVIRENPSISGAVSLLGDAAIFLQNQGYHSQAILVF